MPKPWTRQQLDGQPCSNPDCTDEHPTRFIHSACHTGQGNEVEYLDGVLHIRCRVCKKPVIDVLVAARTPPPPPPSRVQAATPRRRRR